MNKFFACAVIPVALWCSGCATCDKARLDTLETRLSSLESKTGTEAAKTASTESAVMGETAMESAPVVEPPETPTKEDIQNALKNAGYYTGDVDGKFGPKTKKAIEDFQSASGLNADGKVGPNTWSKLKKFYSPIKETAAESAAIK